MNKIDKDKWASLHLADYRPRFFLETWILLLHRSTPHFYQSRIMSSFSCLREVYEVSAACQRNARDFAHFKSVCQEARNVIAQDDDIQEIVGDEVELITSLFLKTQKCEKADQQDLEKIQQLSRSIHRNHRKYLARLIEHIKAEIFSGEAESPKRKRLEKIYSLTSKLISNLLYVGYSSTFLLKSAVSLTSKSVDDGNSFRRELDGFFKDISRGKRKFLVVQPYRVRKLAVPSQFTSLGLESVDNSDERIVQLTNSEQYKKAIRSEISASDHLSASWIMQQKLEALQDALVFKHKRGRLEFSSRCAVTEQIDDADSVWRKVDLWGLMELEVKRLDLYSYDFSDLFNSVLSKENSDKLTAMAIARSLHHYRLGITDKSFSTKLLSVWISLESIMSGSEQIIEKVSNILPPFFAFESLVRRLRFAHSLLSDAGVDLDSVIDSVPEDISDKLRGAYQVYMLFLDEDKALKVYNQLSGLEFERYLFCKIREEFCSKEAVIARYEKTKIDVSLQIRRIYFLRNKIVHQGEKGVDAQSRRMYLHLIDYVTCLLNEIIVVMATNNEPVTLRQITLGLLLALENRTGQWKKEKTLNFNDLVFLNPIM